MRRVPRDDGQEYMARHMVLNEILHRSSAPVSFPKQSGPEAWRTRNSGYRVPVGDTVTGDSPLAGLNQAGVVGRAWPVAPRLELWPRLQLGLRLSVDGGCGRECRLSGQFLVLLWILC